MEEKLRILFLITDLGRGGAERSITDLCLEFKKHNEVECIIAHLLPLNEFKEVASELNVVFLDYKINSFLKKSHNPAYHNLVASFKPHIIHSNRFLAEFLTAEKVYKDVVYVCHGRDNMVQLQNFSLKTLANKRLFLNYLEKLKLVYKKYLRTKTFFVANSQHTKSFFLKVLPEKSKSNVFVIHNGVNLEKFYNRELKKIDCNKKIRIINVGSFQEKKNQKLIVEIAFELKKRKLNFQVDLLGDGILREQVEKKAKDLGLIEEIQFRGKVEKVEEWLKNSDIYLHTAWYEPFGIVFLEAMAAGLPVVTLDGKGNRELIKDRYNGFFIETQDPKIFADRIEELCQDPVLYSSLSENAKKLSQTFAMKDKANEYLQFYRMILQENSRVN